MCGIAGLVKFDGSAACAETLSGMANVVSHRGPDGSGVFVDGPVGLSHRRLAIIDLSDLAAQPMAYEDRYFLTYNGEIYNYLELRDELTARSHTFVSRSDAEVILAAYAEWGEKCVERFNGMWAFLIYDRIQKSVFASRDRFGIKPLYFVRTQSQIAFASEIKQLLPFLPSVRVNKSVLADFFVLGLSQHSERTFFDGISQFPPSHSLTVRLDGRISKRRYYALEPNTSLSSYDENMAIESLSDVLHDSIRLRLRSDVTVGACLSGGLDSSTICAIAAKSNPRLIGITASSGDAENDETRWAGKMAMHSDLDWHQVAIDQTQFGDLTAQLAKVQEEPFPTPSIYLQYCVFKKAAELNCKVMLDGQGGDETLLGYSRYYPAYLLSLRGMERIKGISNVSRHSKLSIFDVVKYAAYFLMPSVRRGALAARAKRYLYPSVMKYVDWTPIDRLASAYSSVSTLQIVEILTTQLPRLLMYEDKNSMAHSIESRLPYLDYRLVELAVSISGDFKMREGWSKWALRKVSERHLPHEIAWRRDKIGFEAPSADLLRDNRRAITERIESSEIGREWLRRNIRVGELDTREIWKWYFVACWEQAYGVSL